MTPGPLEEASSLPGWTDWVSVAQNAVQIVALVVGAVFAYWKFFRGRTFPRRLEPAVTGEWLKEDPVEGVLVRVSLKNTGAADVPLDRNAIRIFTVGQDGWGTSKTPGWDRMMTLSVFKEHEWIESQEVITDEVLIPLRSTQEKPVAYRVDYVVLDKMRLRRTGPRHKRSGGWSWRRGHRWVTRAVVLREPNPDLGASRKTPERS